MSSLIQWSTNPFPGLLDTTQENTLPLSSPTNSVRWSFATASEVTAAGSVLSDLSNAVCIVSLARKTSCLDQVYPSPGLIAGPGEETSMASSTGELMTTKLSSAVAVTHISGGSVMVFKGLVGDVRGVNLRGDPITEGSMSRDGLVQFSGRGEHPPIKSSIWDGPSVSRSSQSSVSEEGSSTDASLCKDCVFWRATASRKLLRQSPERDTDIFFCKAGY